MQLIILIVNILLFKINKDKMFDSYLGIALQILVSGFIAFIIAEFIREKMIRQGVSRRDVDERIK